jgi:hypothetical protein
MEIKVNLPDIVKRRIGLKFLAKIRENTLAGIDAHGKPMKGYSTRPFARPMGGIPKNVRLQLDKEGKITYYRKKGRATWVVIEGGYLALKSAWYEDGGKVNMTATGKMLRSMRVRLEGDKIIIEFSREEEAEKAYWHNVSGAGKSRVIREFLGLPDDQASEIAKEEIEASNSLTIDISGDL